jgi:hypothetical protein
MRRITGSNAERGGHIGGDTVPYSIGGDEGVDTSYIVLGTDVAGVGFNLLEPRLELGSRVIGDRFGEVDGLGCRHGWWDGDMGMVGWMEGWMRLPNLDR